MSDDVDTTEIVESEPQGPRAGERLAAARREQQISVLEIAKELHLDEYKVRALERNEFDVLGAPVFAKGHLKKYAQLVNVDVDDVLADYYRMNRAAEAPPVISVRPRPRQELSPGPWISIIVVGVALVSAYFWFTRPVPPASDVDEPVAAANPEVETDAQEATDPAPQTTDPALTPAESADGPAAIDDAPVAEPEPRVVSPPVRDPVEETSSPTIAEGQVRVLLTYTGDCWTEITDATGRRLFFDLGRDGRTVELSGAEPLNVLFGSPGNVDVVVNGDDFALPDTARPDRPLRLTLSGN